MRKSYRVKSEKDFQQVFESGDSVANRAFVIYTVEKTENKHFRVGISVGKKVGHTAVARNRLKRYIRAVIDEEKLRINPHVDFLIITRPYARDFNMIKVRKNLLHALALAHIIEEVPDEVEENILTKRNVKRLLAVLAVITLAVVLTGCASQGANGQVTPVSHTSGNWWDRWIVYYMSAFILWLAKLMGNSYGWAIIVFTIIVRVILLPLNAISIRSTTKMQSIQPQINELRKKYPGRDTESRTLLQQETNKLYKEAGVNPYTGCLPVIIQLPVMYALYGAILRTPQLQTGRFLWMDLSKPDPYYIMPILAMVFTFLSTYISQLSTPKSSQNGMTKVMMYGMSIMVGVMALNFQSAITLYWVISNLFQAVQTFILQNPIKYRKEQEAKNEAERERKRKLRKTYKRLGRKNK